MRTTRLGALALVTFAVRAEALEPVDARPLDAPVAWSTAGVLRSTEAAGAGNATVALWTTYRAVETTRDAAARTMLLGEATGAYGLTKSLTLGLAAPVLVRGYGVYGVPLTALGDARAVLAHTIMEPGVVGPGLAWSAGFRAPTGDRASGVAYAAPALTGSVHGEYRAAIVELLGHVGASHLVGAAASADGAVPEAPKTLLEAGFGLTMRMRDLLRVGPNHPRLELAGTVRHALSGTSAFDAVFVHLSERFFLDADDDLALVVGLGAAASGPTEAFATAGLRYTPRTHDRDGDGVPDRLDQCPELEEDRDGFEDGDGCPEIDNDNDEVGDEDDKCPNEAGPAENDGCPVREAPAGEPSSQEAEPLPPR
jgi:OOP family OmpA-OmpF porin